MLAGTSSIDVSSLQHDVSSIKKMLAGALDLLNQEWQKEEGERLILAKWELENAIGVLDTDNSEAGLALVLWHCVQTWHDIQNTRAMSQEYIKNPLKDSITNIGGRISMHDRTSFERVLTSAGLPMSQASTRSQFWKSYFDEHKDHDNAIQKKRRPRKPKPANRRPNADAVDSPRQAPIPFPRLPDVETVELDQLG